MGVRKREMSVSWGYRSFPLTYSELLSQIGLSRRNKFHTVPEFPLTPCLNPGLLMP